MTNRSNYFRLKYLEMVNGSREALIPSAFSMIDMITYLYDKSLILEKDRLDIIVSKGHAASVLYPFISEKYGVQLDYGKDGSPYAIYANTEIPCIAMPSGSLGHGIGVAAGYHLSKQVNNKTFIFVGDGECFEGSIWESIMFVANSMIENIVIVVDYNDRTILGDISKTYPRYNLTEKLSGFGIKTLSIDGHDDSEIAAAFDEASSATEPYIIVAKTIKGKGVPFMEESHLWHNRMPNSDQMTTLIQDYTSKVSFS